LVCVDLASHVLITMQYVVSDLSPERNVNIPIIIEIQQFPGNGLLVLVDERFKLSSLIK